MPKLNSVPEAKGSDEEKKVFKDDYSHYKMSKEDLEIRISRKNGFDDSDKMFSSYIDPKSWPYKSMIFDPRPYTVIVEKAARLIGSKPKGRLVPREGGDTLGAVINNELLSYQWDDNSRLGQSMITKWIDMDMNARKYGSAFGICDWNYTTKVVDGKKKVYFDGPDFRVLNPRDVLVNPSYSNIKHWFQYREWSTLKDLQDTNDSARSKPVYKNLGILRDALAEEVKGAGDRRDTEYTTQNKTMRGLTDYMGSDEMYKSIELINERRCDRWVTFAPKYGVVVRDDPNPFSHGEINVVHLKYYPLIDDIYGVSEFEPVAKLIRGINALSSQYIDNITTDLYPPLMINPVNVRMHTIEFTPEAKWLMNKPGEDVVRLQTSTSATNNFNSAYQILVGALLNAWGEASQGVSTVNPTQDAGNVTATEIKDTAFTRNVRDSMNQIFLSEALKKQIMFWHSMNQQLMFQGNVDKTKIIRVVGQDAVDYFNQQGLSDIHPTEDEALNMEDVTEGPRYPVDAGEGNVVPKFAPDVTGRGGDLYLEPGDLTGTYDYIPDIEAMQAPSDEKVEQKLTAILGTITNPAVMQMLQAEGVKPKVKDLLVKMFESTRVITDAEAYFEKAEPPQMGGVSDANQTIAGGEGAPAAGPMGQGNSGVQGMAAGNQAMANGQNQAQLGGSPIL